MKSCKILEESLPPEVATPDNSAISPSGKYKLNVFNKKGQMHFEIQESNSNKKIYVSQDTFEERYKNENAFLWDTSERIWVYSRIGIFYWEQNPNTKKWEKYIYFQSSATAPDFLKQTRPKKFIVRPEVSSLEKPAISPSGKYVLKIVSQWDKKAKWLRFQVLNQKGRVLFTSSEKFAAREAVRILWDRDDRIWVYADPYIDYWERKQDNDWVKHPYFKPDGNVTSPDFW